MTSHVSCCSKVKAGSLRIARDDIEQLAFPSLAACEQGFQVTDMAKGVPGKAKYTPVHRTLLLHLVEQRMSILDIVHAHTKILKHAEYLPHFLQICACTIFVAAGGFNDCVWLEHQGSKTCENISVLHRCSMDKWQLLHTLLFKHTCTNDCMYY